MPYGKLIGGQAGLLLQDYVLLRAAPTAAGRHRIAHRSSRTHWYRGQALIWS
jgi:hypothetical protein